MYDNDEPYRLNMTEKYINFMTVTNVNVEFDQTMTKTNINFFNNILYMIESIYKRTHQAH